MIRRTDIPDHVLHERFSVAVRAMVERLGEERYLWTEVAPDFCVDGHPTGLDLGTLRGRLVEEIGEDAWEGPFDLEITVHLLVTLYQLASSPTDGWVHGFCGGWHPKEYSHRRGRYDFTVEVNKMLRRFDLGLRMRRGQIESLDPDELAPLFQGKFANLDRRTVELVEEARRHYRATDFNDRVDAIRLLVQAFERAKSVLGNGDKRRGAARLEGVIVPDSKFPEDTSLILTGANHIGHDVFRHEEIDRPEVRQDLDIDFWYFFYLNLLRAADQAGSV